MSGEEDMEFQDAAHRLSIYLTHEEYQMLVELRGVLGKRNGRGKVSQSDVVAVAIRRMHKELVEGKED